MKTTNLFLSWLVVGILTVPFMGCDNSTTGPLHSQSSDLDISDINNIIWTLNQFPYAPLQLIFNQAQFFGYDGCNWFGGRFEARGDSLFPRDLVQTKRGCDILTFPLDHLAQPFRLVISNDRLRIFSAEETVTYKSDFTESVENSDLVIGWQLLDSTDPEFADIQAEQLLPYLNFNRDREFKIVWNCVPENNFECNEIFGVFGIGKNGKITFYQSGSKSNAAGLDFMERIFNSSSYSIINNLPTRVSLILVDKSTGWQYEFSSITAAGASPNFITLDDTVEIAYKDTLFNAEENIWLSFDSLLGDSRCPVNVDCVWEGNAELGFVFSREEEQSAFSLNTSWNFETTAERFNYQISLIGVLPVPHTDSLYVAEDYRAKVAVRKL